MAPAGLLSSLLAAVQASLSVLLVIFYGMIAAKFKLLDSASGKKISKVCVKMFLPALLITKVGSELHAGAANRYLVILIWALVCHVISFLIGIAAHLAFGFPDWATAAIMFNNTTSYPLLLIQSLDETGLLSHLIITDETTRDAIERAKSYFLVFATVSSCLTFAVGPRLIDTEHAPDLPDDKSQTIETEGGHEAENREDDADAEAGHGPTEQTGLISRRASTASMLANRRAYGISPSRWLKLHPRTRWWLLFLYDFLNAPLLGAILGAIIGLVPALHRAFFNDTANGGIFTAWLTASLKNVGGLFVPLPVVVAGVSLYTSMTRPPPSHQHAAVKTPWVVTIFILVVRFVLWPVMSIAVIYALATKTDVLGSDPMLWFAMMLMPTGPSAMKLIAMVEVSEADEEEEMKITRLLTVCTSPGINSPDPIFGRSQSDKCRL
jgi:auxin efflux carrier family protein